MFKVYTNVRERTSHFIVGVWDPWVIWSWPVEIYSTVARIRPRLQISLEPICILWFSKLWVWKDWICLRLSIRYSLRIVPWLLNYCLVLFWTEDFILDLRDFHLPKIHVDRVILLVIFDCAIRVCWSVLWVVVLSKAIVVMRILLGISTTVFFDTKSCIAQVSL